MLAINDNAAKGQAPELARLQLRQVALEGLEKGGLANKALHLLQANAPVPDVGTPPLGGGQFEL